MRRWWRDHWVETLLVLLIVAIIGITILVKTGDCTHGHHSGSCGRQYKEWVGKMYVTTTCECVKDHY